MLAFVRKCLALKSNRSKRKKNDDKSCLQRPFWHLNLRKFCPYHRSSSHSGRNRKNSFEISIDSITMQVSAKDHHKSLEKCNSCSVGVLNRSISEPARSSATCSLKYLLCCCANKGHSVSKSHFNGNSDSSYKQCFNLVDSDQESASLTTVDSALWPTNQYTQTSSAPEPSEGVGPVRPTESLKCIKGVISTKPKTRNQYQIVPFDSVECKFDSFDSIRSKKLNSTLINYQTRVEVSTKRLMKELRELMKKQNGQSSSTSGQSSRASVKDCGEPMFSVELVDDCLYEWYIKIHQFDKDSQIFKDMVHHNIDYVQLHAIFPESYPFEPPFVRVISPYIERGFVMEGGAICLELLTKNGWTSAYTIEAVVLQLMASFVKGQATIRIKKNYSKCFTKKTALNSFRHIVRIHNKHGWVDSPLYEG